MTLSALLKAHFPTWTAATPVEGMSPAAACQKEVLAALADADREDEHVRVQKNTARRANTLAQKAAETAAADQIMVEVSA